VPIAEGEIDARSHLACDGALRLATGDVLDDGAAVKDLVVVCYGATTGFGSMLVFKGSGDGGLDKQFEYDFLTGHPSAVALGDWDGNAFADAAVTLADANQVVVFLNDGKGYATAQYYPVCATPTDVVAADLDGDGDDDLVVMNRGAGSLSLIEQTSPGTLDTTSFGGIAVPYRGAAPSATPVALAAGNFDGTGGDDIAVATESRTVEILGSSSSGSTTPLMAIDYVEVAATADVVDVQAGLFFGGRASDLAVLCTQSLGGTEANGSINLYENKGPSGYLDTSLTVIPLDHPQPAVFYTGDYDDGTGGDFAAGHTDGHIQVLMQSGPSTTHTESFDLVGSLITDLVSDKLNSDNPATKQDLVVGLVVSATGLGVVTVILNKGTGFE